MAAEGGPAILKRVAALNRSGVLSKPLQYGQVKLALASVPVESALRILNQLEVEAPQVSDPPSYVKEAVAAASLADAGGAAARKRKHGETLVKEEMSEADRLERHIGWLNRNKKLKPPMDPTEVMPALDSIGYRQAMRVLRRFEESCHDVSDPNEYVKDSVARSGWIWARPDIVDEDERVAKRVAWLNQFGMLSRPIDYFQVADLLDGLKVPHAMVVLRELEVKAHSIDDPTAHIKAALDAAGVDDVFEEAEPEEKLSRQAAFRLKAAAAVATAATARRREAHSSLSVKREADADLAASEAPAPPSQEFSSIASLLNSDPRVRKKASVSALATVLRDVGPQKAAQLLQQMQSTGKGLDDPLAFLRSHARGPAAALVKQEVATGRLVKQEVPEEPAEWNEEEYQEGGDIAAELDAYFGAEAGGGAAAEEGDDDDDVPVEEGVYAEFEDPEGEEDVAVVADSAGGAELVEYDLEDHDEWQSSITGGPSHTDARARSGAAAAPKRVVGGLSGSVGKLVPDHQDKGKTPGAIKLPPTPQERLVRVRDLAVRNKLDLDFGCLKELARLPYHRAKDLIDDCVLGGKWRTHVSNPSRYLLGGCAKMQSGLGVEQGIAMELAVSIGVVLNNDALDELASIPRKESHAIIREVATNEEARYDPLDYIRAEVLKTRAQLDARPFPPTGA